MPKTKRSTSEQPTPLPSRGQFRSLSIEALREIYAVEVGRPTTSDNRTYLEWKIRRARNGEVRIGPRRPRESLPDPVSMQVRFEPEELEAIDAACIAIGHQSRSAFIRSAIVEALKSARRSAKSDDIRNTISASLLKIRS